MDLFSKIREHWMYVLLTLLGGAAFTLWSPISDIFFTGLLHPSITLDLKHQNIKVDEKNQLVAIHILATNTGHVPVELKKLHSFNLEIRKIESTSENSFVDTDKMKFIASVDILRHIKFKPNEAIYIIEPNSTVDELEVVNLPIGTYWVNATWKYENADEDYETDTEVFEVSAKKD